jgi:N-acetylmuramoyl-L-alanine amidase
MPATTTPAGSTQSTVPAVPVYKGPMIVLDPGHGGTDTGARGETGAVEKDLVLDYARMARSELESEGFHVVMTRNDDSNPSYADRAALANSYRDAIFISLHVSSTGTFGTVHTYYYQFGSLPNGPKVGRAAAHPTPLVLWEDAQLTHVDASERLANALQVQFAQRFSGSPATASAAAVRELRSVNAPAVAIEVASVSVQDPNSLAALAGPLAVAIARGLQAFRGMAAAASGAH